MGAEQIRKAPAAIALTLELEPQDELISGSLEDPSGTRYPFVGWLDLTSLLETLRRKGPAPENALDRPRGNSVAAEDFTAIKTDEVPQGSSTRKEKP